MKYIEQFYDVNDYERNVINDLNQYKQNKIMSVTSQPLDIANGILIIITYVILLFISYALYIDFIY